MRWFLRIWYASSGECGLLFFFLPSFLPFTPVRLERGMRRLGKGRKSALFPKGIFPYTFFHIRKAGSRVWIGSQGFFLGYYVLHTTLPLLYNLTLHFHHSRLSCIETILVPRENMYLRWGEKRKSVKEKATFVMKSNFMNKAWTQRKIVLKKKG